MAPPPVSELVRIRDDNGGLLAVERALTPGGHPILVHSGSPGSRRLQPSQIERAAKGGFCLVYDRPGYGDSSPRTGRAVADAADDVALFADALGYAELAVWGFSGGGPFALAAAARLPQVVRACCVISSLAPYDPARPSVARSLACRQPSPSRAVLHRPGQRPGAVPDGMVRTTARPHCFTVNGWQRIYLTSRPSSSPGWTTPTSRRRLSLTPTGGLVDGCDKVAA
jgi:pimeloyl-ACP methyl ester carboxylesterase